MQPTHCNSGSLVRCILLSFWTYLVTLQNQSNDLPPRLSWHAILNIHHSICSGIVWTVQDVQCVLFGTSLFLFIELSWAWRTLHNSNLKHRNVQSNIAIEIIWSRCTQIEIQLILNTFYWICFFFMWPAFPMEIIEFKIHPNAFEGQLWTSDWISMNFNECTWDSIALQRVWIRATWVSVFDEISDASSIFDASWSVCNGNNSGIDFHYRVLVWMTEY